MKKFLSLVLALVMTMSLVTVSAGAKDFEDSDKLSGERYEEAVNVMSEMGIIDGYAESEPSPDGWAEFMLTKEEKLARKQKAKESAGKGDLDFSSRDEIYTTLEGDAKKHAEPRKKKAKKGDNAYDGEAVGQTNDAAQRQSPQDVPKSKDKNAEEQKSDERSNSEESKSETHDAAQQPATDAQKGKDSAEE